MNQEREKHLTILKHFIELAKIRKIEVKFPDPQELIDNPVLLRGFILDFGLVKTLLNEQVVSKTEYASGYSPQTFSYSYGGAGYFSGASIQYVQSWPRTENYIREMGTKNFWGSLENLVLNAENKLTEENIPFYYK